jgi:hypothetical protein
MTNFTLRIIARNKSIEPCAVQVLKQHLISSLYIVVFGRNVMHCGFRVVTSCKFSVYRFHGLTTERCAQSRYQQYPRNFVVAARPFIFRDTAALLDNPFTVTDVAPTFDIVRPTRASGGIAGAIDDDRMTMTTGRHPGGRGNQ